MKHEEAAAEAARLNRELGARDESVGLYTPVERAPGEWAVEFREERPGWFSRLLRELTEVVPR